ncbi:MAG: hypothetical protein JKY08_02100 [Flavobacteriaceae bacterium]|nr:hypothetical protein [Flavobacteriaceae bacterium]
MIIIYKNRGILVPVFIIIPVVGILILSGVLERNIGGIFASNYDKNIILGIGLVISGIWTYLKRTDYNIVNGEKEEIEMNNHLFFISLNLWSKILFVVGLLTVIYGVLETLNL